MSQQISKTQPDLPNQAPDSFSKINSFFDGAVLIARRCTDLLSAMEPAVMRLFLLLHLIIDLGVILLIVFILGVALLWKFL